MPGKFLNKRTVAGLFDMCPASVDRLYARDPEFPRKVPLPFSQRRLGRGCNRSLSPRYRLSRAEGDDLNSKSAVIRLAALFVFLNKRLPKNSMLKLEPLKSLQFPKIIERYHLINSWSSPS